MKELAVELFELINYLIGTISGGVEGPRIILEVSEVDDNTATVTWKNPQTCGLSDRRYHYIDQEVHTDTFSKRSGTLFVPDVKIFSWGSEYPESRKIIEDFKAKYGLEDIQGKE